MRQLSDREGNGRNRNRAQMSQLWRENGDVACTDPFERAIVEGTSVRGSYSREGAWPDRAAERLLEEGVSRPILYSLLTQRTTFVKNWELPLMRRRTAEQYPTFFVRSFAVWHRFLASLAIQGAIQAWNRGRNLPFFRQIPNDYRRTIRWHPRFGIGADNRRFPN